MLGFSIPDGFRVVVFERVESTNEEIRRLGSEGAADNTLVWAKSQSAGRGRRGRSWISPPGNLYCSLLVRPNALASKAMQLGFVASLAVADAVAAMLPGGTTVRCKWPNDVLIQGRKVAGILLESSAAASGRLEWVAIGVGINIASHPRAEDIIYPATSLTAEGADHATAEAVLEHYCQRFRHWHSAWQVYGFSPIRNAWLQRAYALKGSVTVRLENETFEGVFADLDADGALVLEEKGTRRFITAGDVFSDRV